MASQQTPSARRAAYDSDAAFGVDAAHSGTPCFWWEPEQPGPEALRVEGTFALREGRLVIDQLTYVGPSRCVVGSDGERRRRSNKEQPPGGIDSAAWKQVRIGEALGRLRMHQAGKLHFIQQRITTATDPEWAQWLQAQVAQARQLATQPRRGRRVKLTDDFLARLSEDYLAEVARKPHRAVIRTAAHYFAAQLHQKPNTVKSWLTKAKQRGFLQGGGSPGVAYAQPGPKLIEYRQQQKAERKADRGPHSEAP
jgi:hypothetical protein